jgi:SAM-dependent methyltransferase
MTDNLDSLILDLLEFLGPSPRLYSEVLDAWRTSCPRLPVWEEANLRGYVERQHTAGRGQLVSLSPAGAEHLRTWRGQAVDPFGGRHPTSHERLTGLPWDASYHHGPAPWDIGRPQPAIARVASTGGFAGSVLDVGCGTGENALLVASFGLSVLGVDVAETALSIARAKADERGIEVEFAAADAFQLERLGRRFETVLDCGLFHSFDGDERPAYVASLASVTEDDGTLYVLCFNDEGPETGPHPVSREEVRAAFDLRHGWRVAAIEPDRIQTRFHDDGAPAWLATIKRM